MCTTRPRIPPLAVAHFRAAEDLRALVEGRPGRDGSYGTG